MKITLRRLGMKTGPEALANFGASCDLLIVEVNGNTYNYMVDGGMETKDDAEVTWRGPKELGALENYPALNGIFITHAHRDHAGAIPLKIVRDHLHDDAWILGTVPTIGFLPFVWHDQCKVSAKRGERLPYGQFEIHNLRKRFRAIPRPQVVELVPDAISVLVWPSAHIRGGCSYIFRVHEGTQEVKIMFSGDYCTHDQLTTAAAPLPPDDWYPDIIASFDCTNGAEDLTANTGVSEAKFWQHEMERMADDGHRTVKAGGKAFYYAFAMDRTPTFARRLADLGLTTWLDGPSAIELMRRMNGESGTWCDQDLAFNTSGVSVAERIFQPLEDEEPCAIVAPGGMGHGPAIKYFKHLLPRENCLVASSGYQAHGTNGWRIGQKPRGERVRLEVDGEELLDLTIAARTEQYRATAHSLRGMAARRMEELISRSQFRRAGIPLIGLTHGTSSALGWFTWRLDSQRGIVTFRSDRPADREIVLVD